MLVGDYHLNNASLRLLLLMLSRGHLRITIPEVVVCEVVGKYKGALQEQKQKLETVGNELNRIRQHHNHRLPEIDVSGEGSTYEDSLRDTLSKQGVGIAPVPDISHTELVQRAIDRTKPFNENKGGYRDSLIWFTVLEEAKSNEVAFVSANHKDFQVEKGGALHPHLVRDMESRSLSEDRIKIYPSAYDFRKSYVSSEPGPLQNVQQRLRDDQTVQKAFENRAREATAEHLQKMQLGVKRPVSVSGAQNLDIDPRVNDKAVTRAFESDEGLIIVDLLVSGSADLTFEYPRESTFTFVRGGEHQKVMFVTPGEPYPSMDEIEDESDEPGVLETGSSRLKFQAALTVTFDPNSNEISRAEVMEISWH